MPIICSAVIVPLLSLWPLNYSEPEGDDDRQLAIRVHSYTGTTIWNAAIPICVRGLAGQATTPCVSGGTRSICCCTWWCRSWASGERVGERVMDEQPATN